VTSDQAEALRALALEHETEISPSHNDEGEAVRLARIIAITSGKGGVGKTSLAVNLSVMLAQMNRKVVLLDADLGTANADVLCNTTPTATLAHVVAGRCDLADIMLQAPGGFHLIPGASGLANMAALSDLELSRLVQQMHALEAEADLILIDTGAGVGPGVLSFCQSADELLVVTTPEPTAITDAYAVIKSLTRYRKDLDFFLVVNSVRNEDEARQVHGRIANVCRRFLGVHVRMAGHIPADPKVPAAVRRRCPFVLDPTSSPASQSLHALANRLDRHAVPTTTSGGLLHRMRTWLTG